MTAATKTFFDAWGMADADAQRAVIGQSVTRDATYADPRLDTPLVGPDAIAAYVAMFAAAAPGAVADVVNETSRIGVTRVTIAFRMADGKEQLGQYFVEHTPDGMISRMVGFVGTGEPV